MSTDDLDVEVLVVGAGFAGMYLIHRLREAGFDLRVIEAADDVGGTWYWNRYPGARCDIPTVDYSFSFDPELERDWTWSEKYATHPEILAYAQHVADRYDLRRDITFSTRLVAAEWDDAAACWQVTLDPDETLTCRYLIMATGCLSLPKDPGIDGVEDFTGRVLHTTRWPHEPADFTGERVAVIGTGSSGVQSIPIIAEQASHVTVFQRTPNFSIPAHNGPVPADKLEALAADRDAYREAARWSRGGIPGERTELSAVTSSDTVRRERFEEAWSKGELFGILGVFNDVMLSPAANEIVADMIRDKIRGIVEDPATAELLCPTDHPFGTKRPCLDTDYFATYNRDHVDLVDLHTTPITRITETGIELDGAEARDFDSIVFATGFDAMTGALVSVDLRGRDGMTLKRKWADGPTTYLGVTAVGFPNLFMITGPGSPSVLSNMMVSIEQHVDWVTDALVDLRDHDMHVIEPTPTAEAGWVQHVNDAADITLYPQADSWYMGANIEGKPRVFLPYVAGVDTYREACDEVVARGYLGFRRRGPGGEECNDGVVCRLQPDVSVVLKTLEELGLPTIDSMDPEGARQFSLAMAAVRPPGPDIGEITDGVLPGADGDLNYRLYRPDTPGPHPVVVYFHGGGWVLGSHDSDDPLCRDLAQRADCLIISVDYRHAPEHRFPAAPDDAMAAARWVADHAVDLGGRTNAVVVAGYSAGANLAAVVAQQARGTDLEVIGQMLLTPVTDYDPSRASFTENGEGYLLTRSLMDWFWDHYAEADQRHDVRAAPLRNADLTGLPPAVVITCEFDPLRDEGIAYAEAMAAAGVPVTQIFGRGHTHTSLGMVDVVISGAPVRAEMAEALRELFAASANMIAR